MISVVFSLRDLMAAFCGVIFFFFFCFFFCFLFFVFFFVLHKMSCLLSYCHVSGRMIISAGETLHIIYRCV